MSTNTLLTIKRVDGLEFSIEIVGYGEEDSILTINNSFLNKCIITEFKKTLPKLKSKIPFTFFITHIQINEETIELLGFVTNCMKRYFDYDGIVYLSNPSVTEEIFYEEGFMVFGIKEITVNNKEQFVSALNARIIVAPEDTLNNYSLMPRFRLLKKDKDGSYSVKYY